MARACRRGEHKSAGWPKIRAIKRKAIDLQIAMTTSAPESSCVQVAGGVLGLRRSPFISGANDVVARILNVDQRENTRARSAR